MLKVTTENSIYIIDLEARTWSTNSVSTRTRGGVFEEIEPLEIGKGMSMLAKSLTPGRRLRWIYTSDIKLIEEIDSESATVLSPDRRGLPDQISR